MFSVQRFFKEQFLVTKSQKIEIFFQTRNAMNVGMTYFGSRGFCGAIGVSFSRLDRVIGGDREVF